MFPESAIDAERPSLIATTPEPAPVPNGRQPVWELVIADMQARNAAGTAHYGTPLQPFNGRDALVDAYQEALDLCVYLRQEIDERRQRERATSRAALAADAVGEKLTGCR